MTRDDEPNPQLRKAGRKVSIARMQRGIDATTLARVAKVDPKTLRALENGTQWPRDLTRRKIEVALELPIGTIESWYDGTEPPLAETPSAQVETAVGGPAAAAPDGRTAADQLRAANIAVAAERMEALTAEDIATVQDLIDELGRARYSDWDARWGDDYDLAWNRRAKLGPLPADEEQAALAALPPEE
ncbi:helix-turn-helix domain-containing protein [Nocardia thailandica]|uniref:helix-turn-helix domain-containing protein n=1 Tax=Nocardia thailandica TaxID=257275 RepID=UPI0012F7FFC5|nr:helix-turn-helix transcriptional regulator [Nocardia thailandica]